MEYRHHVSEVFVRALNALHEHVDGGWWRSLLGDPDIFIAFRDGALNAYYRGCSLAQLRLVGTEVRAFTHYKYLLKPALKSPMVEARQGVFQFPANWGEDPATVFTSSLADLSAIKRAAKPYAGGEKKFVGEVIRRNNTVFDVEIALTREAEGEVPEGESGKSADRIDIASLKESEAGVELVFYEAKLFQNGELRASGDADARVIGQIGRYVNLLGKYQAEIRTSCLRAAQNVVDLEGLSDSRKAQAKALLGRADSFTISTNPFLIVGDFDADQRDGDVWKKHHQKLVDALEGRLIVAGNASSVRL
ncbi:hypothetical protein [Phenylobacterium sp.]|uniref:hypothetical protein n=1 Tax=Phenylobacterium sp. TaxID=1871053 RepID=UPI0025FE6B6C|nr:hypothetical protein [Phenylobacterium sp.]